MTTDSNLSLASRLPHIADMLPAVVSNRLGAGSVNSLRSRANHAATLEADIQPTLKLDFTLRRRMTAMSPPTTLD